MHPSHSRVVGNYAQVIKDVSDATPYVVHCINGTHPSGGRIYMQNALSPQVSRFISSRVTSSTFHSRAQVRYTLSPTQTHSLTRYCDGAVSGKFNARDVTKVSGEGV